MKNLSLLFYLLLAAVSSQAQQKYFEKVFGTTGTEAGRSVKQLASGSIFVLGYSSPGAYGGNDICLTKLDRLGNVIWTNYYGDALNNYGLCLNKCLDGNLILSGETETFSNGSDAFALKVDTNGNSIWYYTYGNFANQSFRYIEATRDGGYIACGFATDLSNSNDFYVMKLTSTGQQVWVGNYGGSFNDDAYAIKQIPDGGFLVTGDTNSDGAGSYDVEVIRLDSLGSILWDGLYGDSLTNGSQGIILLKDGNYAIYGETEISPNSAFDFFIQKIDTSGTSLWRHTFGGSISDALFSLVENEDKSFVFTGYSNSYAPGPLNLVVGKTDSLANLQWLHIYGDSGIDMGYQIIASADSGYLVIGNTFQNGSDDFFLLHVNDSGQVVGMKDVNHNLSSLGIHPNPTSGNFTIVSPFAENAQLRMNLYTLQGTCILQVNLAGKKTHEINLPEDPKFSNGLYLLQLSDGKKNCYSKFCIQK